MTAFPNDGSFLIGAYYWESAHSINMWEHFSPEIIDHDFERRGRYGEPCAAYVSALTAIPAAESHLGKRAAV